MERFRCEPCNMTYFSNTALAGHNRVVHEMMRYLCGYCTQTFKQRRQVYNHILRTHKDSQYNYTLVKVVENENESASGGRREDDIPLPVQQQVLEFKPSSSSEELNSTATAAEAEMEPELISTSAIQPELQMSSRFRCETCNMTFVSNTALAGHNRVVHEMMRFLCGYCTQTFKQRRQVYNHVRRTHQDKLNFENNSQLKYSLVKIIKNEGGNEIFVPVLESESTTAPEELNTIYATKTSTEIEMETEPTSTSTSALLKTEAATAELQVSDNSAEDPFEDNSESEVKYSVINLIEDGGDRVAAAAEAPDLQEAIRLPISSIGEVKIFASPAISLGSRPRLPISSSSSSTSTSTEISSSSSSSTSSTTHRSVSRCVSEFLKPRHKCKFCNKYFKNKNALQSHVNSFHFGKRSSTCPHCQKSFSRTSSMNKHIKLNICKYA